MATRLLSTQRVVNLATDPASGTAGELYYNTTTNVFKYYNGTIWTEILGAEDGASITVSETSPSPAAQGDLWLNSGNFKLYVYYDSFWVEIGGSGGGGGSLPTQTGQSGKYLTTNGVSPSWSTVELGADTTGQYIASVSGTTNQISVSGSGTESVTLTLSTPQDIHSGASPSFAGATLDQIKVGITAGNEIDTTTGNLVIDSAGGTVTVDDNLTVSGNLTVNGTTITVNSTTLTIDDPIITLGGDTILSTDDGKDRGIEFRYFDTESRLGFMGYNDSTGEFILLTNATNTSEVFSGTKATLNAHISGSNINAGTVSATYIDSAIARLASPTFTGTVVMPTSASGGASMRIPHGSAPSSPTDGDIWTTTSGLFARINGTSQQYAQLSGATFTGTVTGVSPTDAGSTGFRKITMSTSDPTGGDNGDVWLKYI